jgi:hypothetical protein
MSDSFDPYHKWLGIPPAEQPPHHYRLLGLALFEHDGDVIEIAADQRMALLRSFHSGPHSDLSQKLLNEVAAARLCLLKPDRRQRYDEILRARFDLKAEPPSSAAGQGLALKTEKSIPAKPVAAAKPAMPSPPVPSKPAVPIKPPTAKPAAPAASAASPPKVATASPGMIELVGKSAKKSREIELAPRTSDWDRAIADACSTQTVVRRRRRRFHVNQSLVHFIIGAALIGGMIYGGSVGFRMWQDYEFKRANLAGRSTKPSPPPPPPPATTSTTPAPDDSSSDSSSTQPDVARTPAPNFGSRNSINVPPPPGSSQQPDGVGLPPNTYTPTRPNPGGNSDSSAVRNPVPSTAAQKKAADEINDVLKKDYQRAAGDINKIDLAHYLARLASETHDDPVKHYVLDDQALAIAIKFGDVPLAAEVVRDLAANYQVDAWEFRIKTLNELSRGGGAVKNRPIIAEAAHSLVDEAIADGRYDVALDLANLSLRLATAARAIALRDQARDAIEHIKQIQRRQAAVEAANSTLAADPDDAEANLVVGKYQCLIKQDWTAGLPHLAKGSDEDLRKLAEQESQPPTQAAAQLELADAWWDLAQRRQDPKNEFEPKAIRARAAYWYRAASPNLSGISQAKAIRRAAETP